MGNVSIVCKGIEKSYGSGENRVEALKSTDLEIFAGDLTLLVGPSGSGKTTLISIIATVLTPDAGSLNLLGQDIKGMDEDAKSKFRCHHIGIVFQSLCLIPALSVLENVSLPLIVAGESEPEANSKAMKLLDYLHLGHRAYASPAQLSKGQQQRVAIARAMINEAPIIICDEPTSALDHTVGFEVMEFLKNLAHSSKKTVLVVTHDSRIFEYGDRVVSMCDGRLQDV